MDKYEAFDLMRKYDESEDACREVLAMHWQEHGSPASTCEECAEAAALAWSVKALVIEALTR